MNKPIKIAHLINESGLFLSWVKQMFNREEFENHYIIINSNGNNSYNENGHLHCDLSKKGKEKSLKVINECDISIHYFLDYTKSELILKSNSNVRHFWYFFGADIYQQLNIFRKHLYGSETKKWMRFSLNYKYRLEFRAIKHLFLKQVRTPKNNLLKSMDRIEKLLWYIEDEIKWINEKVKMPAFAYFKFFTFKDVIPFDKGNVDVSKKSILIGNSAAIENNHLDVLKVFKNNKILDYQIALPLTYGNPEKYKQFVKKKYELFFGDNFKTQEKSLSLLDYYSWLNGFPTAIMLHYRQQALGNLFYLIANGTKVYLSEKNILLNWFQKNKIEVFSFEKQFINDYQQNNLTLNLENQKNNYLNLKNLLSIESSFIEQIINDFK